MIELLVNEELVELSEDFQILINKSIADIRNPENRSSDWSKTITIPGTSVNNKLFGHLFEVGDSITCLLYTSPSPRDRQKSRMPSSA